MTLSRIAATAVVITATATTAMGCTRTDQPAPGPSAPWGSPSDATSDVVLTPPELPPGHRQIAHGGPRRGAADLGVVRLGRGVTWVNVNCVADSGAGSLTLVIDTVGEFTVSCPSTTPRMSANQLDLAEGGKGRFHIETAGNVRWSASIQVPE